jgi:hypothetical protein
MTSRMIRMRCVLEYRADPDDQLIEICQPAPLQASSCSGTCGGKGRTLRRRRMHQQHCQLSSERFIVSSNPLAEIAALHAGITTPVQFADEPPVQGPAETTAGTAADDYEGMA